MEQIVTQLENKIKEMIDELKGLCQTNGLSNQASEEVVITSVFLYKFLNDKFMANLNDFSEKTGMLLETILKNEHQELIVFYNTYPQDVAFKYEDTIEYLINKSSLSKIIDVKISSDGKLAYIKAVLIPQKMWNITYNKNDSLDSSKTI